MRNATAFITGGAQGLGKGFARAILELGGKVSLIDVLADIGQETEKEFNTQFGNGSALFIKCDVRKKQEIESAYRRTRDTFGRLDIVVNNAGVGTITDWERTIDINLTAVLRSCFLAVDYMGTQKGGSGGQIINIASTAGLAAVPFDPAYAASKHGVVGLSRSLALMLESQRINVKCLCPSFADTEIVRQYDKLPNLADKRALDMSVKAVGLMDPKQVVAAFVKLLEDENANGGVMAVTPAGYSYKFRGKPLSKL